MTVYAASIADRSPQDRGGLREHIVSVGARSGLPRYIRSRRIRVLAASDTQAEKAALRHFRHAPRIGFAALQPLICACYLFFLELQRAAGEELVVEPLKQGIFTKDAFYPVAGYKAVAYAYGAL